MKRGFLLGCTLFLIASSIQANGVAVVDASQGVYLRLLESHVDVQVENQIAVVRTQQVFWNNVRDGVRVKYAFPLPNGASATALSWIVNGQVFEAEVVPKPQSNALPGSGNFIDFDLLGYLGGTPLLLDVEEQIPFDAQIRVTLTYVQRLPYALGDVRFRYPSAYNNLQDEAIAEQRFSFNLTSARTIEHIEMVNPLVHEASNTGQSARIRSSAMNQPADTDYEVRYRLDPEAFGVFGASTLQAVVPDGEGNGFFVLVAEPDPTESTEAIDKVFTLMIDQSGSMAGGKMAQAKRASRFIVESLNEGDSFNIVGFNQEAVSAFPSHQPFEPEQADVALSFIDSLIAEGSTNYAAAFAEALSDFPKQTDTTAHIVLFFTDGRASSGPIEANDILRHVRALKAIHRTDAAIFTVGIGNEVDRNLLTQLALEHEGLAEFLGPNEIETRIADFYGQIRNPVLLNPVVTFDAPTVTEVYPRSLPNLYRGQQLTLAGRYESADMLTMTLSGRAFGQPFSFTFDSALSDSSNEQAQVLPQVWAKLKIESLLIAYYQEDRRSAEAEAIRQEVIDVSVAYGVQSPFTTFELGVDDIVATYAEAVEVPRRETGYTLHGAYPNPFTTHTTIRVDVPNFQEETLVVKVYNAMGQLVRLLTAPVAGPGLYDVHWDGRAANGLLAPSGTYFYVLHASKAVLSGTVTLVR